MDKAGNVDIFLRLIGDLGLDETVLIEGAENTGEIADRTEEIIENSTKTSTKKQFQIVTTIHVDGTKWNGLCGWWSNKFKRRERGYYLGVLDIDKRMGL